MVDESPGWDDDLSPREVERLAPKLKSMRNRSSLERKVRCLEKWSSNVRLAKKHAEEIRWKRPGLREWHDPELKLWRWSFSPVDLPSGRNSDLMNRYFEAINMLRKVLDEGREVEIEALELRVESLEKQNLALLDQISRLQRLIPNQGPRR